MTREDKQLLFRDLCSRLPYGVKCTFDGIRTTYGYLEKIKSNQICTINGIGIYVEHIKPYLFPLSSMTEEQCDELYNISELRLTFTPDKKIKVYKDTIEWFLKNHIDYNGLIDKGLAIDATNLNIY